MSFYKFLIVLLLSTSPAAWAMSRITARSRKTISNLFNAFSPFSFSRTRSLHHDHLKHLYNGLTDEAKPFSPIHGAALAESGWLKRLYQYGSEQDALTKLVSDEKTGLFHLRDDQFRPTQNKSNPCYSLNPRLVGTIIGSLQNNTFDKTKDNIAQQWKDEHNRVADRASLAKINAVLDTIQKAAQESKHKKHLLPHSTQSSLLGFLHLKANKKEEPVQYLESLHNHLPVFKESNNAQQLIADHYSNETEQKYAEFLENFKQNYSQTNPIGFATDHYEQTIITTIKEQYANVYPPQVIQSAYAYGDSQNRAPDCFETSMRSIFNRLLVNHKDSSFDLSMLPDTISPRQELIQFYIDYCSFDSVNNQKDSTLVRGAGQAWMNTVSDSPTIEYVRGNYEIRSSAINVINLFNYLLNIKVTTFQELGEALSDHRRKITFQPVNDIEAKHNTITITITEKNQSDKLLLTIVPGHTFIKDLRKKDSKYGSPYCLTFLNAKDYELNPLTKQNLSCLTALNPRERCQTSSDEVLYHYFISQPLHDPNQALLVINEIFYYKHSPAFFDLAFSLMQSLPNDEHFIESVIKAIIRYKIHLKDKRFEEYLKNHIPLLKKIFRQDLSGEEKIFIDGLIYYLPQQEQLDIILDTNEVKSLLRRFKYGENHLIDALIFKNLLPLKRHSQLQISHQEQKESLKRIFNYNAENSDYLNTTIADELSKSVNSNIPGSVTAYNLLEYTLYKNKLSEFIELLNMGAQSYRIIDRLLLEASWSKHDHNPQAALSKINLFLKEVLNFKPSADNFNLNLSSYTQEEIFKLFLDAGYNQDEEFVKRVFTFGDDADGLKKIKLLCSYGISSNLQSELLLNKYRELIQYMHEGWDMEFYLERRQVRKVIRILKKYGAQLSLEHQQELDKLKKQPHYSWLQNIL